MVPVAVKSLAKDRFIVCGSAAWCATWLRVRRKIPKRAPRPPRLWSCK